MTNLKGHLNIFGIKYRELSDEKLMKLVIGGDAKAFGEIYDRYSRKLLSYFHRMLWKDREKAEDFMQDLFTKIVEKPERFNPERSFKTWLYSVANNMCKNEYKKQEVRKSAREYEIREEIIPGDNGNDLLKKFDNQLFLKSLQNELDKLEAVQKETFILRYYDELSIKEISEILSCSEGTVKSRLFYTLKKLAPKLKMYAPPAKQKVRV